MKGRYELTEDELKQWISNCKFITEYMVEDHDKSKHFDLTKDDLTPLQAMQVLKACGWEHYASKVENLECKTYWRKKGFNSIFLYSNGLTFELSVGRVPPKDNILAFLYDNNK